MDIYYDLCKLAETIYKHWPNKKRSDFLILTRLTWVTIGEY